MAEIARTSKIHFKNLEDADENMRIEEMKALRFSPLKTFVLVPILGICSGLIFLLFLYWYESLQAKFFYDQVTEIEDATHILVTGASKL